MAFETAFTMDTSSIKFGPGVTKEVGFDMRQHGARAPHGDSVSAPPSRHVN
jgi:hypothetical protein